MQKLELPKIIKAPEKTKDLCKCRPICRNRRREWNDQLLKTSDELLFERKPKTECQRRQPMKLFPNSACPLFGKSHRVTIKEKFKFSPVKVVKICHAPIDDTVDTTYLRYAELAKKLGAWQSVRARCAFCSCCACCSCAHGYALREPGSDATQRRSDMRDFNARVRHDQKPMLAMYDKELFYTS